MVSSFETDRNEQISENSTKALTTSTPAIKTNREIACPKSINEFTPMKKAVRTAFKTLEELFERKEMITGAVTGYIEFDNMTAGLQPSDLIILAGRPSMGKTAFAMNMAQHMALVDEVGVGIFSLEMSHEQLIMRLFSSVGRIDSQRIRSGRLFPEDWPKLSRAVGKLENSPVYIDDSPDISAQEIRAKVTSLAAQHNIGLIIVDYLQLMRGPTTFENRSQEISENLRTLKAMAKELNITVLVLSQLKLDVETRPDKRPMISDLPDSEVIEQEADVICFIYRDEVYNKTEDSQENGTAEIIIKKHRNGQTGTFKLRFLREYSLFENIPKSCNNVTNLY